MTELFLARPAAGSMFNSVFMNKIPLNWSTWRQPYRVRIAPVSRWRCRVATRGRRKGGVIPDPRLLGGGARRGRVGAVLAGGDENVGRKSREWESRIFYPPLPAADEGDIAKVVTWRTPAPLKTHFSRPAYQMLPVAFSSGISSQPDRSGAGLEAAVVVPECCARAGFLLRPRKVS